MGRISEMLRKAEDLGYTGDNLTARVCQDIVLNAISRSTLNRNVTIKGGVVMREITGDVRRATQDMDIEQEEFCFDIEYDDEGVSLLINSKEQMFAEKLRSLLKFGAASTRYKDIFDMYYLKDHINASKLEQCISEFILIDQGMKENNMSDIISRLNRTFKSNRYRDRLTKSDKNWLGIEVDEALNGIMTFVTEI